MSDATPSSEEKGPRRHLWEHKYKVKEKMHYGACCIRCGLKARTVHKRNRQQGPLLGVITLYQTANGRSWKTEAPPCIPGTTI